MNLNFSYLPILFYSIYLFIPSFVMGLLSALITIFFLLEFTLIT